LKDLYLTNSNPGNSLAPEHFLRCENSYYCVLEIRSDIPSGTT